MSNQDILLALAAVGSAFLTSLALLLVIGLVLSIERVVRSFHDRRVIRGKLDRQMQRRIAEALRRD